MRVATILFDGTFLLAISIGIIMSSGCPSVTLCIVALRVSVRVKNSTVVFLTDNFLPFTSSDTFAVACIVQPPQNTQKNEPTKIRREEAAYMQSDVNKVNKLTSMKLRQLSVNVEM